MQARGGGDYLNLLPLIYSELRISIILMRIRIQLYNLMRILHSERPRLHFEPLKLIGVLTYLQIRVRIRIRIKLFALVRIRIKHQINADQCGY